MPTVGSICDNMRIVLLLRSGGDLLDSRPAPQAMTSIRSGSKKVNKPRFRRMTLVPGFGSRALGTVKNMSNKEKVSALAPAMVHRVMCRAPYATVRLIERHVRSCRAYQELKCLCRWTTKVWGRANRAYSKPEGYESLPLNLPTTSRSYGYQELYTMALNS